jgi:hypothetical protein
MLVADLEDMPAMKKRREPRMAYFSGNQRCQWRLARQTRFSSRVCVSQIAPRSPPPQSRGRPME